MQGDLSGHYALGSDIDATATTTWNANAGFNPVGTVTPFTGVFDGLGHSVSQLNINRPATPNVGMFGTADQLAEIRHVGLIGGSVVGALAPAVCWVQPSRQRLATATTPAR
jgi:hypothetical protein